MGLDMFLYRRKKFRENDDKYNELVCLNREEACYWRKANQIRQWFVNNTNLKPDDNCVYIELTKEDLEKLKTDCEYVLNHKNEAKEIMPTSSGFFFGNTDYDEYYFNTLEYTKEEIEEILKFTDFNTEVIEYSEWW